MRLFIVSITKQNIEKLPCTSLDFTWLGARIFYRSMPIHGNAAPFSKNEKKKLLDQSCGHTIKLPSLDLHGLWKLARLSFLVTYHFLRPYFLSIAILSLGLTVSNDDLKTPLFIYFSDHQLISATLEQTTLALKKYINKRNICRGEIEITQEKITIQATCKPSNMKFNIHTTQEQ